MDNPTFAKAAALPATAVAVLAALAFAAAAEPALAGCKNAKTQPRATQIGKAERAVVCLINAKRAKHGLRKLKPRPKLRRPAQRHSRYMHRHDCFAHVCPGEADVFERLRRSGYLGHSSNWGYGETIGWGSRRKGTPRKIVRSWMRSPAHRKVILTGSFRHVGVGGRWGSPFKRRANAATFTADFGFARG